MKASVFFEEALELLRELAPRVKSASSAPKILKHKDDASIATATDLMVDRAFAKLCSKNLPQAFYLGEESVGAMFSDDPAQHRNSYEAALDYDFIVTVDSIDGTQNFSLEFPLYAAGVGITEKRAHGHVPSLGAVMLPALGVMYYTTSSTTVICEHLSDGSSSPVNELLPDEIPRVVTLQDNVFNHFSYHGELSPRIFGCAMYDLLCVGLGASVGTVLNYNIWDFTAPLAIAKLLGVNVYDFESGAPKEAFNAQDFVAGKAARNWALCRQHLFCRPTHVDLMRSALKPLI